MTLNPMIITEGKCRDCAQGILMKVRDGFEFYNEDGDERGFWFCRYCGSHHVTVEVDGKTIEQGDMYEL